MSKWEKLIKKIITLDSNLQFEEVKKVLKDLGYTCKQPRGGSSHYIFRKEGCNKICIPKHGCIKVAYIKQIRKIIEGEENGKRS